MEIFDPVPEEGKSYTTIEGHTIKVQEYVEDIDGSYVVCVDITDNNQTLEYDCDQWNNLIEDNAVQKVTINATCNNSLFGFVEGTGEYAIGASVSLKAVPFKGYKFIKWDDGDTSSIRTFVASSSVNFVATFDKNNYSDNEIDTEKKEEEIADENDSSFYDGKLNKLSLFLNKLPFKGLPFIFPDRVYIHKTEGDEKVSEDGITETTVINEYEKHQKYLEELRDNGRKLKPKYPSLNEFLWICAGADRNLLRMCPHDQTKYACIGGTILTTALCAALSSGYACSTIFEGNTYVLPISVGIALFWGVLIFNLDRMITNTMYSDGKPSISMMEILSGLPRIIMAIIIGIVISTPLELKIFKGEIDKDLTSEKKAFIKERVKQDTINYKINVIDKLRADIKSNKEKVADYGDLETEHTLIWNEAYSSKRPGAGKEVRKLEAKRDSIRDIVLPELERQLKQANDTLPKYIVTCSHMAEKDYNQIEIGLSRRIESLLKTTEKDPLSSVHLFIALFFIIIEITPVLMKMMMSSGVYDVLMDKESDISMQKYRAETQNMINLIHGGKLADAADEIVGVSKYGKSHGWLYYMNFGIKTKLMKWATGKTPTESDISLEKNFSSSDNKRYIDEKNHKMLIQIVDEVDMYVSEKVREILHKGNAQNSFSQTVDEPNDDANKSTVNGGNTKDASFENFEIG